MQVEQHPLLRYDRGLLARYLDVVNQALERVCNEVSRTAAPGGIPCADTVEVRVHGADTDPPEATFIVAFDGGKFVIVDGAVPRPRVAWRARRAHLEGVLDEPATYVAQPGRFEFGWLDLSGGASSSAMRRADAL